MAGYVTWVNIVYIKDDVEDVYASYVDTYCTTYDAYKTLLELCPTAKPVRMTHGYKHVHD